jgi:hypothetical protein
MINNGIYATKMFMLTKHSQMHWRWWTEAATSNQDNVGGCSHLHYAGNRWRNSEKMLSKICIFLRALSESLTAETIKVMAQLRNFKWPK